MHCNISNNLVCFHIPVTGIALCRSEKYIWMPKFCGRKGKIELWLCHFLNQIGLMNQQMRGEIKTLKIFKTGQKELHLKTQKNHRTTAPHWLLKNICVEAFCAGWEKRQECHSYLTTSKANTSTPNRRQNSISLKDMYGEITTDRQVASAKMASALLKKCF